jgi:sortase A
MKTLLLWIGLGCLGYCIYITGMERLNQSYDNWVFEKHISGSQDTAVSEYLHEHSPLGFLLKDKSNAAPSPQPAPSAQASTIIQPNAILGKLEISRLNLSAMVREGVDTHTLSEAVGHVPSTPLPGHSGNFALAAHRDTLFRALKDIKRDDLITFQSQKQTFTYQVQSWRIVTPTDVSVLGSDGHETLTLITCYPFYYVGSAPKRFIVRARLVPETELSSKIAFLSPH